MADVRDLMYHGIRHQIRVVLEKLGDDRIDKGLNAFEDGESNWSRCFFAQALADDTRLDSVGNPELEIARVLDIRSKTSKSGFNLVPIRIVWRTFDSASNWMTKTEMMKFMQDVRDQSRPSEVLNVIRQVDNLGNYDGLDSRQLADTTA